MLNSCAIKFIDRSKRKVPGAKARKDSHSPFQSLQQWYGLLCLPLIHVRNLQQEALHIAPEVDNDVQSTNR